LARISIKNLFYRYKKSENWVLKGINFQPPEEGLTALIGDNGSGKTTLGKLMAGILKPFRGQVLIDDQATNELSLADIGQKLGYIFQEPERQIFAPTVEEELSFVLRYKGVAEPEIEVRLTEMLDRFDLRDLRRSFPFQLSQGEKQRLALAAILINQPEYLILDEPTTALDLKRKEELLDIIKGLLDRGIGITVISHDHKFAKKYASRLFTVAGGELVENKF